MMSKSAMFTQVKRSMGRSFSSLIPTIDVHTHMYTPRYMEILKKRVEIPKVIPGVSLNDDPRLVILPNEEAEKTTNVGRPIGREYWDVQAKLNYMKNHNITTSVISLANPWLDFVHGQEALSLAEELNDELEKICEESNGKLYGFATLPVRNKEGTLKEIARLKSLKTIKGVILGTPGAGNGLDHQEMRECLHAIAEANFTIFLHPHYGVGNEHYHDSGHALFLALGFPFETTVSVSRMILSGLFDEIPNLKILVAHAGAALPSLIGRLDSCVAHDLAISNRLSKTPSEYMKNMYFDAISYSDEALGCLLATVGPDRIMFGTDNPFFPPLNVTDIHAAQWPSTVKVQQVIGNLSAKDVQEKILHKNAEKILGL